MASRTRPVLLVAGATVVQSALLVVWSTRATTIELTGAILAFAAFTAVIAAGLVWRNTFEARLAATVVATYALTSGILVVTIGLPAMGPDRDDPVAIISIVGAVVGYVGLELDRQVRARRAARRRARSLYA